MTDEFAETLMSNGYYFIQIIRDHRDVVASNKKSSTGAYPVFLIRQWRESVQFILKSKKNSRFLMVRYEDITSRPEKFFKDLCDSIGLPFHPKLIGASSFIDGAGNPWKQNSSFKASKEISKNSIDKWKTNLTSDEISTCKKWKKEN